MTSRSEARSKCLTVRKAVGTRIAKLRKQQHISQEVLADSCGLHRSHMGEIERGECNFTLSTLLLLVMQLDITVSDCSKGMHK